MNRIKKKFPLIMTSHQFVSELMIHADWFSGIPDSVFKKILPKLDPFSLGIIIVGPWRGKAKQLISFRGALKKWQKLTGWPILADPLSGVENDQEGLINHWDLFFSTGRFEKIKEKV